MDELTPILGAFNFEIIDASEYAFADQVRMFASCGFLAGVHGAGLTNMMFREGLPMKVLEIAHPFRYIPFHYIMLSQILQFDYEVILGTDEDIKSGGFRVDPDTLKSTVEQMLKH